MDHQAELTQFQRKMIKDVVIELLTPIKQNMNVDLKTLRKVIQDCNRTSDDLSER